jgi:hypothetical protein
MIPGLYSLFNESEQTVWVYQYNLFTIIFNNR